MKNKTLKSFLLILLCLSMLVTPQVALAEEDGEITEVLHTAENEVVDLRSEYSQTFQNPDGTFTAYIYTTPIFYRDADGELTQIDNRIVRQNDGSYTNAANELKVKFADIREDGKAVSLSYKDYALAFSPQNVNANVVEYTDQYEDLQLPETIPEGNSVLYQNVYDNVDMSYTVSTRGVKENIIIKSYTGKNAFSFDTEINNLRYAINEYEDIIFVNEDGESIFALGELYAVDANGYTTLNVQCMIEEKGENKYVLTLVVDEEFLASAAYPVIVDPSYVVPLFGMATLDTFVANG